MSQINRRSVALLFFLILLLIQFGKWQEKISETSVTEDGHNSLFLLLYIPILFITLYMGKQWGYLYVFRPLQKPLLLFLIVVTGIGLFRNDLVSGMENAASIVLTYSLIIGLSAMSFSLPFRRMLDVYIIFIAYIFLPITIFMHITKFGSLVLFPDRTENNNLRLGGIIYYAHTAMVLGIGGLFSLYQYIHSRKRFRFYYVFTLLILTIFLVFTDCRSSWGGVAVSYSLLILFNLSKEKRWPLIGVIIVTVIVANSGTFLNNASKQYQTGDDFIFRLSIWNFAIEGIADSPLIGYGKENYFASNKKAMDLDDRLHDPHSATLSLALQSGLIVLIIFCVIYYKTIRHYYRNSFGQKKPLIAVCIFWLFVPFFWGHIYNGSAGFMQIVFPLTYFISLLHPDLYHPVLIRRVKSSSNSQSAQQVYNTEPITPMIV